jgi:NodT family efflux transporter outer membrane factor (OMF) lipoprotein
MKPRVAIACGFRNRLLLALVGAALLSGACMVGPNYHRPSAPVPPAYKEAPPAGWPEGATWNPAQPNDGAIRGRWWEVYNDPQLNALEEQVNISNQNVLMAAAQFREARDAVRIARAALFPTVTTSPSITRSKSSETLTNSAFTGSATQAVDIYDLPFDVSYQADIWGSIRRSVRSSVDTAQASFAMLENARLMYQSELAEDYFSLHGTDGEEQLLQTTIKAYEDYLKLTQYRFKSGVASGLDIAQAQTQLDGARVQLIDLGVARAQFEHAIAVLAGKPPAAVSIPHAPIPAPPPPTPAGVPSTLLERRPDIAAAERQMAAQNEQIGIAVAAYYPTLTLNAAGGFETAHFASWLGLPSRFWSIGPEMAETILDFGKRRGQLEQAKDTYDATIANYRQTVLTAFQQVEDNLAALRVLQDEAQAEDANVKAAQHNLDLSVDEYKAGIVDYLTVITAQGILLGDQVQGVSILTRRMMASVVLVEALGGGWNASTIPTPRALEHGK